MTVKQNALNQIADMVSGIYASAMDVSTSMKPLINTLKKSYKGADVPDADIDYIAQRVAKARDWTIASMKTRKSELRNMIVTYDVAGDALTAAEKLNGNRALPFSKCLQVCRAVKNGKGVKAAAASIKKADKVAAKDRTKAQAVTSVKAHIKRVLEHTQISATFRLELKKLAAAHDLLG